MQLTDDLVYFQLAGIFGWGSTPAAFQVVTRAITWELRCALQNSNICRQLRRRMFCRRFGRRSLENQGNLHQPARFRGGGGRQDRVGSQAGGDRVHDLPRHGAGRHRREEFPQGPSRFRDYRCHRLIDCSLISSRCTCRAVQGLTRRSQRGIVLPPKGLRSARERELYCVSYPLIF
jgi:hypothetical protein